MFLIQNKRLSIYGQKTVMNGFPLRAKATLEIGKDTVEAISEKYDHTITIIVDMCFDYVNGADAIAEYINARPIAVYDDLNPPLKKLSCVYQNNTVLEMSFEHMTSGIYSHGTIWPFGGQYTKTCDISDIIQLNAEIGIDGDKTVLNIQPDTTITSLVELIRAGAIQTTHSQNTYRSIDAHKDGDQLCVTLQPYHKEQ
jgi:hypothetical protein